MYDLILIDDEPVTLRQLSRLYDWEAYGFHLAGTFLNGETADQFLKKHPVDLIISDIKMPQKSGLELAKSCYERYPDTWFIFISAYRDFTYAQEATRYNVIDYITKPISFSAFEESLKSAYDKIASSKSVSFADSNLLALQQRFFSHILCDTGTSMAEIVSEIEKIHLDPGILDRDCALFSVRFREFQAFLDHFWKYGVERFYNAIFFLLPVNPGLFCSWIRYSFDTAEFVCFKKADVPSFPSEVAHYIDKFKENLSEIFRLEFEEIQPQYFTSFAEMRSLGLNNNKAFTSESIIEKAEAYIHAHYNENISLKDVAEHVSLSPIYFSAFFKQHTGENYNRYLTNIRLKKALEYLRDTDIPVVSVCELVGYRNTTHFYNLIKSQIHMTPNEYRAQWRGSGK